MYTHTHTPHTMTVYTDHHVTHMYTHTHPTPWPSIQTTCHTYVHPHTPHTESGDPASSLLIHTGLQLQAQCPSHRMDASLAAGTLKTDGRQDKATVYRLTWNPTQTNRTVQQPSSSTYSKAVLENRDGSEEIKPVGTVSFKRKRV